MKIQPKIYPLLVLLMLTSAGWSCLKAQPVVDNSITAEELVNNYLLGQGVEATNITFNGQPGNEVNVQIGSFNGEGTSFSLDSGVVMVTDDATFAETGVGNFGLPNPASEDPDLAQISGQSMNDGATLEFDFEPAGDSLKFNYVFASMEYPAFVCSQFNDAFGFFLSGPGFNGPYQNNAENIALIPNSDVPVSINTVNNGSPGANYDSAICAASDPDWQDNVIYFIDNFTNPDPNTIAFDGGYTVPLTAEALVECGETYHIKMAIADATDGALNSGVFLEAGSFASNPLVQVEIGPTVNGLPVEGFPGVVEGCAEGTFTFNRLDVSEPQGIDFELSGSAELGVDYVLDSDTVFFEVGEDETTLTFAALADDIDNENESIIITVYTENACGETLTNSASIDIIDDYEFDVNVSDQTIDCPTDSVTLSADGDNGIPPYTYNWSEGEEETNPVTVPLPEEDTEYTVEVYDFCQFDTVTTSVSIDNNVQPPPVVDAGQDTIVPCPGEPATLTANATEGQSPYTYLWSNDQGSQSISVFVEEGSETYTVTAQDACNTESDPDSVQVSIQEYDSLMLSIDDQHSVCTGDEVSVSPDFSGGAGSYEFDWNTGSTDSTLVFNPDSDSLVSLEVTDLCGYTITDSALVTVQQYDPLTVNASQVETECPGDTVTITATTGGGAGQYEYMWDQEGQTSPDITVSPEYSLSYSVTVTDLCGNTITGSAFVTVPFSDPIQAIFSAIPDCSGKTVKIVVDSVVGGAGDFNYEWVGPGQIDTDPATGTTVITNPDSTASYTFTATDKCNTQKEFNFKPPVPRVDPIPNVMTPNGDGKNDRFIVKGLKTGPDRGYFANASLQIFSRWGNEVYSSDNYQNEFEADGLELGTYFYTLRVQQGKCIFNGEIKLLD